MKTGPSPTESCQIVTTEVTPKYQLVGDAEAGGDGEILKGLALNDSRQRLQALIADWLRMENVVVLTGAGCSVSVGGKTVNDLEKSVLESLQASARLPTTLKPIVTERLKRKNERFEWAQSGFEQWLSYMVNALYLADNQYSPFSEFSWKHGDAPTKEDLEWFIAFTSKSIFSECALSLPEIDDKSKLAPQIAFLSKLVARDSNLSRPHLFTLNYDTLFEQALEVLGIQYSDGFTGRAEARFDPAVYGLDIYYPGEIAEGRVRRFDKFLHFYKLHGSIHWKNHEGSIRARHPNLHAYKKFAGKSPEKKAKFIEERLQADTIGILPTANKFSQTLAMPYAHLFRSLQLRLSIPQTFLLILGYGFGDEHINQIIEAALTNPSLIMLVVEPNPDSSVIKRILRYKDMGKRTFILTATQETQQNFPFTIATFDDFSRTIMPNVKWLDDFLRLRRFEKQIEEANKRSKNDPE